jgi:predicted Rossmann-fold nucleotide-binding protein
VGLLNAYGFYDLLLKFLTHMRDEHFLLSEHYSMLTVADDVSSMLDRIMTTGHSLVQKPIQPVTQKP